MNDFEHPYGMLLTMAEEELQAHVGDGGDGISDDNISDGSIGLYTQPDDEFNANDDDTQPRNVNAGDEDGDDDIPDDGDDATWESFRHRLTPCFSWRRKEKKHSRPADLKWNVSESETTENVAAAQTVTYNIRTVGRTAKAGSKMDDEKAEGLTGDKGREDELQEPTASAGTDDRRTKSKGKKKKGKPKHLFLHRAGHEDERKRKKKTGKQPPHRDDSDEDFQVADDYDDDDEIEDEVYPTASRSKKRRTRNNLPKYTPEQFFGVGANSGGEESVDSQYEAKLKAPATTRDTQSQVNQEIPWGDQKPAAKTQAELRNSNNQRHQESTESVITGVVCDDAAVDAEAQILGSDDDDDSRTVRTVEAQAVDDDAAVDIEAQIVPSEEEESDDDEDTSKDLIHYDRDERINDAEYSWILEMPLDRLKEDCRPFLNRHSYGDNVLTTRKGHQNYLFQQYLHEHTKNRRTIITRPISCNQVKDDCASRKFEVCASNLKDLYHCSMYPPWSSDLIANPRLQTFLMVHDEMIQRPDLQKGRTDSKDYVRKRPQTSFLVPDGTDFMELADILENAALKLRACKEISVRKLKPRKTNLVVTSDHHQLCKQIYGKKFEPKNQDPAHKQRKQK